MNWLLIHSCWPSQILILKTRVEKDKVRDTDQVRDDKEILDDLDKVLAHPLHHLLTIQNHLYTPATKHHIQFSSLSDFDSWQNSEWLCQIFEALESPIQGIDNSTSRGHYACCKSCESIKKKGVRRELYPDFYFLLTPLSFLGKYSIWLLPFYF